ncbi:BglG family transcription antiterminator [Carnobacteriaceae bacterium zg-ZUI78]|nr:BglG family transcription antiterminator [Granulicatella sp. zg-84]MBS4750253.1 BglG family transcription antiterminator [Carnobacteriaceae bacterium zg-ZUI78]QMI85808.1 BglG family transcription antiterminator [Carnobacteriaceae bacterium zg-84]
MLLNELIKKIPIFSKYHAHKIEEFEKILNTNRRGLLSDIEKMNSFFQEYSMPTILIENDRIYVPSITETDIFSKIKHRIYDYAGQTERLYLMILYIVTNKQFVSNYHLQSLLQMSKNSILLDLKKLKEKISIFDVTVHYTRSKGYHFKGSALSIRQMIEYAIDHLLLFDTGKWLIQYIALENDLNLKIDDITALFIETARECHCYFIAEKSKEVCYLISILNEIALEECVVFTDINEKNLSYTPAYIITEKLVEKYPNIEREKLFIFSRILGCLQGEKEDFSNREVYDIMNKIIDLVKANTAVQFEDSLLFRKNLYHHLVPSYYRLLFGIHLINPLKEQIMKEYHALFYLIKKSLAPLSDVVQKPISDDEVAYFTIHFGGYLKMIKTTTKKSLVALSVCPNGISSSLLLQSELKALMPDIFFKEVHQLDDIEHQSLDDYDMIFSTVFFESSKKVYVVQPLMNAIEKLLLKRMVYEDFQIHQEQYIDIKEIMKIISTYTTIHESVSLEDALMHYFVGNQQASINTEGLALTTLLDKKLVQQVESVSDWKEAIHIASKPLLEHGYIQSAYIDDMIASIQTLGPYIVLAPKVAVPHAKPDNVYKLGISLLQLKEAVDFNLSEENDEDKKVHLIFVLAAVDSILHLKALQQLASILDDENAIELMIQAKTVDELMSIIEQTVQKGEDEDD